MLTWTRLSMLLLALIGLNACGTFGAGLRAHPARPETTECRNQADHFRCRAMDGTHYSEPYPGRAPLICRPVSDEEAIKNWEATL